MNWNNNKLMAFEFFVQDRSDGRKKHGRSYVWDPSDMKKQLDGTVGDLSDPRNQPSSKMNLRSTKIQNNRTSTNYTVRWTHVFAELYRGAWP